MNILIVDDEVVAVKGLLNGVHWKECGVDGAIWTAYSAKRAMQILKEKQVDVLLCDIEMPDCSGLELLKEIRDYNKNLPCVFLTCHANFSYAQEAISLGCTEYILKPAPYEEIEHTLKRVCADLHVNRRIEKLVQYFPEESSEGVADGAHKKGSVGEIVEKTEQYVFCNLRNSALMVSDIADELHLNKDYLNRVFKKAHGISISQYLIQERMRLAAILLEGDKYTVNRVAEAVGYNNYPYFASSFKRYHGCSPSQYQREHS